MHREHHFAGRRFARLPRNGDLTPDTRRECFRRGTVPREQLLLCQSTHFREQLPVSGRVEMEHPVAVHIVERPGGQIDEPHATVAVMAAAFEAELFQQQRSKVRMQWQ